jgi:ABC-2 type transport system ATP-binding protein
MHMSIATERLETQRDPVISAVGLKKYFGSTKAIDGVSCTLHAGESLCIVGPNGAGKSTLLYLLGGIAYPTQGHVTVFGLNRWKNNFEIRQNSTFLTADPIFGASQTPYGFLRFYAQIYGIDQKIFTERTKILATQMQLIPHLNKPWGMLSFGMIKKVGLVAAFLPTAQVRILDEPFAGGIDPHAMEQLYQWIIAGKEGGETILFSTQVLEQAETASDRLLLLEKGAIIAFDTPQEIIRQAKIDPASPRALYQAFIKLTEQVPS